MQTNAFPVWRASAVTFALAALATLSGTFWVLKSLQAPSVSGGAVVASASVPALDPQALARALGGGQVAVVANPGAAIAPNRYQLVGVLADSASGGAALISVDGKPAKPYRVGAAVDGNLRLLSVNGRRALLAESTQGAAQVTLDMPALSK